MYEEEEKDKAKFALPCKLWEGGLHLTGGLAGPGHNGLHTLLQLAGIVKIREGGPLGKERRRREGRRGGKEGRRERREGGKTKRVRVDTDSTSLAAIDSQWYS